MWLRHCTACLVLWGSLNSARESAYSPQISLGQNILSHMKTCFDKWLSAITVFSLCPLYSHPLSAPTALLVLVITQCRYGKHLQADTCICRSVAEPRQTNLNLTWEQAPPLYLQESLWWCLFSAMVQVCEPSACGSNMSINSCLWISTLSAKRIYIDVLDYQSNDMMLLQLHETAVDIMWHWILDAFEHLTWRQTIATMHWAKTQSQIAYIVGSYTVIDSDVPGGRGPCDCSTLPCLQSLQSLAHWTQIAASTQQTFTQVHGVVCSL